ncbi:MAG: hypothetical protein WCO98_02965 [bacterium]
MSPSRARSFPPIQPPVGPETHRHLPSIFMQPVCGAPSDIPAVTNILDPSVCTAHNGPCWAGHIFSRILVPTDSRYSECNPWLVASRHCTSPVTGFPSRSRPSQSTVCFPTVMGSARNRVRIIRPFAS